MTTYEILHNGRRLMTTTVTKPNDLLVAFRAARTVAGAGEILARPVAA